ncbi:crotonase/enoyl-CoA hydratase family protein [Nocardioides montaniterrae]
MDERRFTISRSGHIATVEPAGPGGKPVMDAAYFAELRTTFRELDADPDVRAIVVAGVGGNFGFGLDLAEAGVNFGRWLADGGAGARTQLLALIRDWQDALTAVAACRTPTVAAIDGWCVGGGVDLAAACDVRLSTAAAKFSVREVRIAIVADLGSLQRLVGIIGDGHLRELALTGDDIDATRAREIGLVNSTYADAATLMAEATAMAERIAANSPLVLAGIKDVLDAERGPRVEAGLRYTAAWNAAFLLSEDLQEAMTAFVERRPPEFTGR